MAEIKWAVEYEPGEAGSRTELMTDEELDRAADDIATQRASGHHVELRLATEEEKEHSKEQDSPHDRDEAGEDERNREQQEQKQWERREREEREDREMFERQQQQEQREREAPEQVQQQKPMSDRDQFIEQVRQDAREGRMDAEAMERLDKYEQMLDRDVQDRRAEDIAALRRDLAEGREHYFGNELALEPNGGSDERWRYRDDQQQDRGQLDNQGQAGGQVDIREQPEHIRAPQLETRTPQVEMER